MLLTNYKMVSSLCGESQGKSGCLENKQEFHAFEFFQFDLNLNSKTEFGLNVNGIQY